MIWDTLYKFTFGSANVKQISKMIKNSQDKMEKPLDYFIDSTTNNELL